MSTRIKLLLVICSVFVAAIAIGSNMGFKLNYTLLTNTDANNANWVGVPYFYQTSPSAQTVCDDIGGNIAGDCAAGTATTVSYFDTANNAPYTHSCTSTKNNFALVPGQAVSVFVSAAGCTWKVVGSHNDAYDTTSGISFAINGDGNNANWISVPYHTTAGDAIGLCTQINAACSNYVTTVSYFDTANNAPYTHSCASTKNNFAIIPGVGISAFVSAAPAANCWHPAHY